jgi:hypothetical protein
MGETEARKFIATEAPELAALLPPRKRGRPPIRDKKSRDAALLIYYDLNAQRGKSVREVARSLHKSGEGKSVASVERKLHYLKARRGTVEHR